VERPEEVSQYITEFLMAQSLECGYSTRLGESLKKESRPEVTKIDPGAMSLSISPFSMKLKRPMKLSMGMLTDRTGLLLALVSESVSSPPWQLERSSDDAKE